MAVKTATRKLLTVAQRDHELPVIAGLQLLDLADIHNKRPVDADELRGIKLICHPADRFAEQICILSCNVQAYVIGGCLDPVDFIHLNKDHATAGLDDQPILSMWLPRCG